MFSLIITIIAIALVAALAVASIYYGGSAFTQGGAKAEAAALVNNAMQVSAANVLFNADNAGADAANVAELVTEGYLASAPPSVELSGSSVVALSITQEVCDALPGATTDAVTADGAGVVTALETDEMQYGCVTDGEDPAGVHFGFK